MDARIVEFAEVLRQNGVRVSTSEVSDAARAAAEVGLQDKGIFRSVLRTTMVKRELLQSSDTLPEPTGYEPMCAMAKGITSVPIALA